MPEIDPNHPITVELNPRRVTATLSGLTITNMHLARMLREASYPPMQYILHGDVQMNLLGRTQHHTHCPYKGDASYYVIVTGNVHTDNAVWTHEQPRLAVREVAGYLAFYPDKVAIQEG